MIVDSDEPTTERLFVPSTKGIYKLTDSLDLESQKFKSVVEFSGTIYDYLCQYFDPLH